MRTLCLGEALVDLIAERPIERVADADAFSPHFGGATANVAVVAALPGARVALAGGAGEDPWGHWLRARLEAEGVELDWFALQPGLATPIAFVWVSPDGEPSFLVYGDGIPATVSTLAGRLDAAVAACDGLFFGSNTLVGRPERELTMRARDRALELGRPVLFDPNFRLGRWPTRTEAAAAANACIPGALLVRCNRAEAELLTGERDPELAARALVKTGCRMALVSLGADGAILRGAIRADAAGVPAAAVSTVGAGDTLMGVLVARLTLSGFYPAAVAAALPEAVAAAARTTERWGAV